MNISKFFRNSANQGLSGGSSNDILAYDFCSDFLLTSPAEITVELSRSVESLLQRNLRTIMEQSINRENAKDLTLTQILQFVTNLSYMEKSVRDVETNIRSHSTGTWIYSGLLGQ